MQKDTNTPIIYRGQIFYKKRDTVYDSEQLHFIQLSLGAGTEPRQVETLLVCTYYTSVIIFLVVRRQRQEQNAQPSTSIKFAGRAFGGSEKRADAPFMLDTTMTPCATV